MLCVLLILLHVLLSYVALAQLSMNNNNAWTQYQGNSQNSGQTVFAGPNVTVDTLETTFKLSWSPIDVIFTPLLGPEGMLIYLFSVPGNHVYNWYLAGVTNQGVEIFNYVFYSDSYSGAAFTPILVDDLVCISGEMYTSSSLANFFGLGCVNLKGQLVWSALSSITAYTAPFVSKSTTMVCSRTDCYAFNSTTGSAGWSTALANPLTYGVYPSVSADGDSFYLTNPLSSLLTAYTCGGAFLWDYVVTGCTVLSSPVLSADGATVYLGGAADEYGDPSYYAVSSAGAEVWTSDPIIDGTVTTPIVGNGMLVVAQKMGVTAFDATTGATLWSAPSALSGGSVSPMLMDVNGYMYAMVQAYDADAYLNVYSAQGDMVRTLLQSSDYLTTASPVISAAGSLYITTKNDDLVVTVHRIATDLHCSVGDYNPNRDNETCAECDYPHTNYHSGSLDCPNVWLRFQPSLVVLVLATMTFIVVVSVLSGERKLALFLVVLFPTLDFFSDIAYIMTNKFDNDALLTCAVVFVLLNMVMFVKELCTNARYPPCALVAPTAALTVLHYVVSKRSIVSSTTYLRSMMPVVDMSALHGCILATLCTILAVVLMLACVMAIAVAYAGLALLCLVGVAVRLPLVLLWFLLGAVMHATKALCIGRVWYFWVYVWGYPTVPSHAPVAAFDTKCYNESMLAEFLLEAFPQLVIQTINNTMVGAWSDVAIFSAALSTYMTLDSCYRMLFEIAVHRRRFVDIPVKPPLLSLCVKDSNLDAVVVQLPALLSLLGTDQQAYLRRDVENHGGASKPLLAFN